MPLLANLRTGRVVVYRGVVPCGSELRLGVAADALTATLDGNDVSDRLITATGFAPGAPLPLPAEPAPRPLLLEPGSNEIWFLPLALYGERILDRAALAMPGLEVRLGVFGGPDTPGTDFDNSLFEEPASAASICSGRKPRRRASASRCRPARCDATQAKRATGWPNARPCSPPCRTR